MEHDPVGQSRGGIVLIRAIVPRRLDRSGVTAWVEQNGTQTERGVYQEQRGGCTTPPVVFALSLLVFFVLARRSRTAPAERDKTGGRPPPFVPLARHG